MPFVGNIARITEFGDPPSISTGQVVSAGWLANITATVNGIGFNQVARAYRILAANGGMFTAGGAIGGWSINAGNFVVLAAGAGGYLLFPMELPYATGASGTGATLNGAAVRVKPAGASAVTAKLWSYDTQNSGSGPVNFNFESAIISSSGTADQVLSVPMTTPAVISGAKMFMLQVSAGQASDAIYSIEVQYTIAGY
jgi:hypothetical protein